MGYNYMLTWKFLKKYQPGTMTLIGKRNGLNDRVMKVIKLN